MRKVVLLLLSAVIGFSADNAWVKVEKLKTGTDVRVFKKNARQPVLAKMDQLTDESLIVVIKNEETAIPRDEIDRIDARPSTTSGPRVKTETKGEVGGPTAASPEERAQGNLGGNSGYSSSASISGGNKPDFETVYRRTATAPVPKK